VGGDGDDTVYGGQGNDLLFAQGFDGSLGRGDHDQLFGNLGNDTFEFRNYDAFLSGTTDANSERVMDFVTGQDKISATTDDSTPNFTEVAAPGVTSVAEAIQFSDQNHLFTNTGADITNEYVFVAGATHGYLIVNPDSSDVFESGSSYVIVLQDHNTLASFSSGDIINHVI